MIIFKLDMLTPLCNIFVICVVLVFLVIFILFINIKMGLRLSCLPGCGLVLVINIEIAIVISSRYIIIGPSNLDISWAYHNIRTLLGLYISKAIGLLLLYLSQNNS